MKYASQKINKCVQCNYPSLVGCIFDERYIDINDAFRAAERQNKKYKTEGCTICECKVIEVEK